MEKEISKYIEFNLNGGARGLKGDTGDTGYSPTLNIVKNGSQLIITITDINGTRTETMNIGDMFKTTYDANNNGIVDNAEMVNNHTVNKDVPADAQFTDTLYDDTGVYQAIGQANERINQLGTSFQTQLETLDHSLANVAKSGRYSDLINPPTKLSDFSEDSTHRTTTDSEKSTWNSKYNKPSGGIPKTDLASAVQTSLGKADTALQQHQDISGKEDKSNKVTSISSSSTDTQYPSAKCVYDLVGDIESILTTLDVGSGINE